VLLLQQKKDVTGELTSEQAIKFNVLQAGEVCCLSVAAAVDVDDRLSSNLAAD